MIISELIKQLQELKEKHGDVVACVNEEGDDKIVSRLLFIERCDELLYSEPAHISLIGNDYIETFK